MTSSAQCDLFQYFSSQQGEIFCDILFAPVSNATIISEGLLLKNVLLVSILTVNWG